MEVFTVADRVVYFVIVLALGLGCGGPSEPHFGKRGGDGHSNHTAGREAPPRSSALDHGSGESTRATVVVTVPPEWTTLSELYAYMWSLLLEIERGDVMGSAAVDGDEEPSRVANMIAAAEDELTSLGEPKLNEQLERALRVCGEAGTRAAQVTCYNAAYVLSVEALRAKATASGLGGDGACVLAMLNAEKQWSLEAIRWLRISQRSVPLGDDDETKAQRETGDGHWQIRILARDAQEAITPFASSRAPDKLWRRARNEAVLRLEALNGWLGSPELRANTTRLRDATTLTQTFEAARVTRKTVSGLLADLAEGNLDSQAEAESLLIGSQRVAEQLGEGRVFDALDQANPLMDEVRPSVRRATELLSRMCR